MTTRSFALLGMLFLPLTLAPFLNRGSGSESERLQRHFDAVEQELLAADIAALTPAQRAARAIHIRRLREYADRGVFPRNTDYPGQMVPYFVDRFGTRCAMAYLIEQSGADEYVRQVTERMNNAYIHEIAKHPELGRVLDAWLLEHGLSLDEAARIQPTYSCEEQPEWCQPAPMPVDITAYKVTAGVVMAGGIATIALNAVGPSSSSSGRTAGWLGIGTGALALATGVGWFSDERTDNGNGWAVASASVGMVSLVLGLYRVLDAPAHVARVAAAPMLTRQGNPGVQLSFDF